MTEARSRRIAVLTAAAQAKSAAKTTAAERGIRALVKRGDPITFQAVMAGSFADGCGRGQAGPVR